MGVLESIYSIMYNEIGADVINQCRLSNSFISRYLANAVLSYIEEKEQDFILSMKYDEWVKISKKELEEIADRIVNYIEILMRSCSASQVGGPVKRELSLADRMRIKQEVVENHVVERTLCYLYNQGIYDDGFSIHIVIKGVERDKCDDVLKNLSSFEVRTRFIEIAKYLYNLKQRFPEMSVFESTPLVDRVFAYAEPRLLPLGSIDPVEAYKRELAPLVENLYTTYNNEVLRRSCNRDELEIIHEVLQEFFKYLRDDANILFYKYQVIGIKSIIESTLESLKGGEMELKILEAPTGAGKTEIFTLAILIVSLVRKVSHYFCLERGGCAEQEVLEKTPTPPVALIVYPRLALASNQIERLIKYLHKLNEILRKKIAGIPPITLSMNYTDVRFESEYAEKAAEAISKKRNLVKLPYGVRAYITPWENNLYLLILTHFKCHNGAYPALIYNHTERSVSTERLVCNNEFIDYIRATKDDAKARPGDIHVTLFETLRNNLLSKSWRWVFGNGLEGPLIIILDEVHTYVGIQGARYAYVLRRVVARSKISRKSGLGFVVIGVSATIPNPKEFIRDLFFYKGNIEKVFIRPSEDELVPMGNEYFYIIVPTNKFPVNLLSVTIQTVMALHFNTPSFVDNAKFVGAHGAETSVGGLPSSGMIHHAKKTLVFIDNLDVVHRALRYLRDAINRYMYENECDKPYGLQDLRNPENKQCFEQTFRDYADAKWFDVQRDLHLLSDFRSWRDGELWWPYSLEYLFLYKPRGSIAKLGEYTSRVRERIEALDIVVATSALEVGIDYRDVAVIYQHGAPMNISSLVQRAGRAGRRVYQNPLTRTVVAIQLSPDIPTHTPYFELFTRVKSLREALKYDRLYVPTGNKYVVEQTLIETLLDYLVATYRMSTVFPSEDDKKRFECELLPKVMSEALKEEGALKYFEYVFPGKSRDEIKNLLMHMREMIISMCTAGDSRER